MTATTLPAIERDELFDLASEHAAVVSCDVDGIRFLVSTTDRNGRALFTRLGREDMATLPAALDLLAHRGVSGRGHFVDVGANIGTTTLSAVMTCGFSSATAVEPDETNVRLLSASAALNGVAERIEVVRAAALDHDRGAMLRRRDSRSSRHTISADGHEHVPSVTLDGLYLPHVGLLWVDAEGSEGQVFAGARDLLRSRPPIVMEFKPESLRAHGGLETVMNVASMYAERLHARTGEPLDLERLAVELDGGGKGHRRVDVLLIP